MLTLYLIFFVLFKLLFFERDLIGDIIDTENFFFVHTATLGLIPRTGRIHLSKKYFLCKRHSRPTVD